MVILILSTIVLSVLWFLSLVTLLEDYQCSGELPSIINPDKTSPRWKYLLELLYYLPWLIIILLWRLAYKWEPLKKVVKYMCKEI